MAKHVRMRPGNSHTSGFGYPPQAAGSCVAVHPDAASVQQDRPALPLTHGTVDCPADRWRQGNKDDLGSLAAHAQHPVTMLFAKVGNIRAGGLKDPQTEQPEHGHEGEVAGIGGLPGCSEQGLELQVGEPQGR